MGWEIERELEQKEYERNNGNEMRNKNEMKNSWLRCAICQQVYI